MLNAQNLSCRRGGRVVFRGVGFRAEPGDFVLVTGANGSGKSTLLRALGGLIETKEGNIQWQGEDVAQDPTAYRKRLHYIGHLDAVKPLLTVREMLGYWLALRGASDLDWDNCLKDFALDKLVDQPVMRLSAGQKRRLSLTRLILTLVPLWLLDEPTTALDKKGQELLRTQIARHRAQGGIVIAASHDDLGVQNVKSIQMGGTP